MFHPSRVQVSDQTSSFSCFCPKFLQQFQNQGYAGYLGNSGYLGNPGILGNPFMPAAYQQLYNEQLNQARQLRFTTANLYGNDYSVYSG